MRNREGLFFGRDTCAVRRQVEAYEFIVQGRANGSVKFYFLYLLDYFDDMFICFWPVEAKRATARGGSPPKKFNEE